MRTIGRILSIGLVAATVIAACTTSVPSQDPGRTLHPKVDQARATEMATAALEALGAGDYAAYSRDWDDAMKAAIGPDVFAKVRDEIVGQAGTFISIDRVELVAAQTPGHVKYIVSASFTKAKVRYSMVLPENGDRIAGARLEPAS